MLCTFALFFLTAGLLSYIIRCHMAIRQLIRQLDCIRLGSRIELTSTVQSSPFRDLCSCLNTLLEQNRQEQQKARLAQKEVQAAITSIAHDLRTPLTSASGYLQMLKGCHDEEKRMRYHQIITRRLKDLKVMLEELFLYTKLTNDEYTPDCQKLLVLPVLSEALISSYDTMTKHGCEPSVSFEEEEWTVSASPDALKRIFGNLIQNAALHGAGNLFISQKGNTLSFSNQVPDHSLPNADSVFDRFYKADQARQKTS